MSPTIHPRPVLLYFDPHPVHEKMAHYVGAELVGCSTGGVLDRVRSGGARSFGDRPVILEGGVPLLEGAVLAVLRRSGPVLALGADATYHDIWTPLPFRSRRQRLAHRASLRFVDGTLAVSQHIATIARHVTGGPVRITHPFVEHDRFDALGELRPDLDGMDVLCVGKYRPKNGQDILLEAAKRCEVDVRVDFVGPDTDDLPAVSFATRHGFVPEERLLELFETASLLAFPAPAGAFPVATLEALRAGLPVLTTNAVGTSHLARLVDPHMVVDADPDRLAAALDRYAGYTEADRNDRGDRARHLGARFGERDGLESFARELLYLLEDLDVEFELSGSDPRATGPRARTGPDRRPPNGTTHR